MELAEKDAVSTAEEATANAFADCLRILGLTPSGNDPRVLSLASKVIELAKEGSTIRRACAMPLSSIGEHCGRATVFPTRSRQIFTNRDPQIRKRNQP